VKGSVANQAPSCAGALPVATVFLVDDDESLCRSFSRLLRTAGFQPVTYLSAEALLDDTKRPHFDCLVLDIQLEGISGLELHRRLKAIHDTTPVVFITAHDDPETRQQAWADGCAGYFLKTDSGHLVMNAIRHAVGNTHPDAEVPVSRAPEPLESSS